MQCQCVCVCVYQTCSQLRQSSGLLVFDAEMSRMAARFNLQLEP